MAVDTPFHRIARPHADGLYTPGGRWVMVRHPAYADRPHRWVRAYLLLQDDLLQYLESVEPSDGNLQTHSLRSADLLIRTCIEVEANLTAILRANTYSKLSSLNMKGDYFRIEKTHFLSQYKVQFPYWDGAQRTRQPFQAWERGQYERVPWYHAYNKVKHDRAEQLPEATFQHLTDAWCGLMAVLTSQFLFEDFSPAHDRLAIGGYQGVFDRDFEPAIGSYLGVKLPDHVPTDDRYDFDWAKLRDLDNPFARFDYDNI